MKDYIIFTDSACDIPQEKLAEWGVLYKSLTYRFSDSDEEFTDGSSPAKEFYDKMRAGGVAKTAAVNSQAFEDAFEEILKSGKDVLYLGFSSGLSTTYNSGRIAAAALAEKYPDSKVIAVDTLSASAGFGLLLYLTVQKKNAGAGIDESAEYAKSLIYKLCHWFTVDDLVYLKRGGRISSLTAIAGTILGIKPVLHMDNEGHLVGVSKVKGRKNAISAMADKYTELAEDKEGGLVFISHGDCEADALSLAKILKDRHGVDTELIVNVGSVIGAHSGPGTLALFFIGEKR